MVNFKKNVERLESIGFQWSLHHSQAVPWEKRFQQLQEWKRGNGDCNVLVKEGKLGKWVRRQRKLRRRGELSQDCIERLKAIGFEWNRFSRRNFVSFESPALMSFPFCDTSVGGTLPPPLTQSSIKTEEVVEIEDELEECVPTSSVPIQSLAATKKEEVETEDEAQDALPPFTPRDTSVDKTLLPSLTQSSIKIEEEVETEDELEEHVPTSLVPIQSLVATKTEEVETEDETAFECGEVCKEEQASSKLAAIPFECVSSCACIHTEEIETAGMNKRLSRRTAGYRALATNGKDEQFSSQCNVYRHMTRALINPRSQKPINQTCLRSLRHQPSKKASLSCWLRQ